MTSYEQGYARLLKLAGIGLQGLGKRMAGAGLLTGGALGAYGAHRGAQRGQEWYQPEPSTAEQAKNIAGGAGRGVLGGAGLGAGVMGLEGIGEEVLERGLRGAKAVL